MTYGIVFENVVDADFQPGFFYAHVPALGLTTHGKGIEGAQAAAMDLVTLWLTDKKAVGEMVSSPAEFFFSTVEIPESALQSA